MSLLLIQLMYRSNTLRLTDESTFSGSSNVIPISRIIIKNQNI